MAAVAAADSAAEATAATAVAAATEAAAATTGAGATEGATAIVPSADAQWGASSFPDSDVDDVDEDANDDVVEGGGGGALPAKSLLSSGEAHRQGSDHAVPRHQTPTSSTSADSAGAKTMTFPPTRPSRFP